MVMLPIIGMSPGNSFFKDKEVSFLLKKCLKRYGKAVVVVADVPATSTYLAMGYSPSKAKSKAKLKGNNLKNRTRRIIKDLGLEERSVVILDRENEVETSLLYKNSKDNILKIYDNNEAFRQSVRKTSEQVLQNAGIDYSDSNIDLAVNYLLSEIGFLDCASEFFGVDEISYVYHKPRDVYENFVYGIFDGKNRKNQSFLLMEAPNETFLTLEENKLTRYQLAKKRNIKAGYFPYVESYFYKDEDGNYKGMFFDIIDSFSKKNNLGIEFIEQNGYGIIQDRLNGGFIDIFCSPTWPTNYRKKRMFFSKSLFTSSIYGYIAKDNKYSQQSLENLKYNENIRIVVKENDFHHDIVKEFFPKARIIRLPQLSEIGEEINYILDNKADLTFWCEDLTKEYMNINGIPLHNIIKKSWYDKPIKVYDNCMSLPRGEFELKEMLDKHIEIFKNSKLLE